MKRKEKKNHKKFNLRQIGFSTLFCVLNLLFYMLVMRNWMESGLGNVNGIFMRMLNRRKSAPRNISKNRCIIAHTYTKAFRFSVGFKWHNYEFSHIPKRDNKKRTKGGEKQQPNNKVKYVYSKSNLFISICMAKAFSANGSVWREIFSVFGTFLIHIPHRNRIFQSHILSH